ncbi:x-box binding protein [Anaeramoeba flamelloides]|uniref:X-box binding protein n=1 Tax=Anaeramoeba flamelloides TaxID=1746091 RepID=A0ABQ8XB59_9EUKA|nr:x-box binding protein [Anaeramoeba flamelloides]
MTNFFDLNNSLDLDFDLNQTDLQMDNSFFGNDLLSTIDDESLDTEVLLSLQEDFNVDNQKSPLDTQPFFQEEVDEGNISKEIKDLTHIEIANSQSSNKTQTMEIKAQKKTKTKPNSKTKTKTKTKTKNVTNKETKKEITIKKNPKNKGIIIQIKKRRKRTLSDRNPLNGNGKFCVNTQPIWVENRMGEKVNLLAVMNKYEFNLLTEEQKKKRKLLKNRISAEESRLRARQRLGGLQTKVETLITRNKKLNRVIHKIQDEKEEMRKEIELLRTKLGNQSQRKHKHISYEPITKIKRTNTHPATAPFNNKATYTNDMINSNPNPNPNPNSNLNSNLNTSKLFSKVCNSTYELFSDLTSINHQLSDSNFSIFEQEKDKRIENGNSSLNESQFGGMNSQQTGFSLFIILLIFGLFFQTNFSNFPINNNNPNQNLLDNLSPSSTSARKVLTATNNQFSINFDPEYDNLAFQKDGAQLIFNKHYPSIAANYNLHNHTNYEICIEYNPKYLYKSSAWV